MAAMINQWRHSAHFSYIVMDQNMFFVVIGGTIVCLPCVYIYVSHVFFIFLLQEIQVQ